MTINKKMFWLDKFEGTSKGGIYYRAFDLIQFINKVEKEVGKVVCIKINETNNIEIITEVK